MLLAHIYSDTVHVEPPSWWCGGEFAWAALPWPHLVHAGCSRCAAPWMLSGLVGRAVHLTPGLVLSTVPVFTDLPLHALHPCQCKAACPVKAPNPSTSMYEVFSVKRRRLGYYGNLTLVDGISLGNLALFPSRGLR